MFNRNSFTKQVIQCLDELPENYSEIDLLNGDQYEGYYFDHDEKRILKVKQFNKRMRIIVINPANNKTVINRYTWEKSYIFLYQIDKLS